MMTIETVRNVPAYAHEHAYWVARKVEGLLWFYGAYDTADRARDVAVMVDGVVITFFEKRA